MKSRIELLEEIKDFIDDLIDDQKEKTEYDRTIDYNNYPKSYESCPHCNSGEFQYDIIEEVLEDAILKVKCKKCENYFYTSYSK